MFFGNLFTGAGVVPVVLESVPVSRVSSAIVVPRNKSQIGVELGKEESRDVEALWICKRKRGLLGRLGGRDPRSTWNINFFVKLLHQYDTFPSVSD